MGNDKDVQSTFSAPPRDEEEWPQVLQVLKAGATLYRPPKLRRFFPQFPDGQFSGAGSVSPSFVKKMEASKVLTKVGADRYIIAEVSP